MNTLSDAPEACGASLPAASGPLHLAGVYRREVAAGMGRIWENVFDWEHLPVPHGADFHAVKLLDRGLWGWRMRLVGRPGEPRRAQTTLGAQSFFTLMR